MITIESLKARMSDMDSTQRHFAELACQFMEQNSFMAFSVVGEFIAPGIVLPKVGDKLKVPLGVSIRTSKGYHRSGRSQNIVVSRVSSGGMYSDRGEAIEIPAVIVWAGSGGYWHEISVRDWINAGGHVISGANK